APAEPALVEALSVAAGEVDGPAARPVPEPAEAPEPDEAPEPKPEETPGRSAADEPEPDAVRVGLPERTDGVEGGGVVPGPGVVPSAGGGTDTSTDGGSLPRRATAERADAGARVSCSSPPTWSATLERVTRPPPDA